MPIRDYHCKDCEHIWENIEVWSNHKPIECPQCKSLNFEKVFTTIKYEVRMDPDSILRSMPDPSPPLRELIGKTKEGCEGGYKELEGDQRTLKEYTRRKDRYGNSIWEPKRRSYFYKGKKNRKSEAERE